MNRQRSVRGSPRQLWEAGFFIEALALDVYFDSMLKLEYHEQGIYPDGLPRRAHQVTQKEMEAAYELRVQWGMAEDDDAHLYGIHTWCNPTRCPEAAKR